ncbi:MAG: DUF6429 family protein [Pseudomonadota bacterium]
MDQEAMNRPHEKGYMVNPNTKAMSVLLTQEGHAYQKDIQEALWLALQSHHGYARQGCGETYASTEGLRVKSRKSTYT